MSEKLTLKTISSGYLSIDDLNENFTAIQNAIDNTISRTALQPNQMEAELDMNLNNIINVADAVSGTDAVNLRTISTYINDNLVNIGDIPVGSIKHSLLAGLTDGDDHLQYHNDYRGDLRYWTKTFSDDRYAYKAHTHVAADITDLEQTLDGIYLNTSGGTINGDLVITGSLTLDGVTHTRLPKINDNTVLNDKQLLQYDQTTATYYSVDPSNIITSSPPQSIFDIGDVTTQDSMGGSGLADGQYLRYGSYNGSDNTWYNDFVKFTELQGKIAIAQLPEAFTNTNFVGDISTGLPEIPNARLVVNAFQTSKWNAFEANGAVGQVLTIVDGGGGNQGLGWLDASAGSGATELFDLTDVTDPAGSLASNMILSYDQNADGTWNPVFITSSMFGTNKITDLQLPLEISYIGSTVGGRENYNVPYFNTTSGRYEDLKITDTEGDLISDTYVLGINSTNQLRYFRYTGGTESSNFSCEDLVTCNVTKLADVPSSVNANKILIRNSTGSAFIEADPFDHKHNANEAFNPGTLIPIGNIPTGTTSTTVSLGNHTHNNYFVDASHAPIASIRDLTTTNAQLLYSYRTTGDPGPGTWRALNTPITSTKQVLSYNPSNPQESKLVWEDFPTSTGGNLYVRNLLDTPASDPAGVDQILVWTSNTTWEYKSLSVIGDNLYLSLSGGILTGPTVIDSTEIGHNYALSINDTTSTPYGDANILSESEATTPHNIRLNGSSSHGQLGIYGTSPNGMYIDATNVSVNAIGIYSGSNSTVQRGTSIVGLYGVSGQSINTTSPFGLSIDGTHSSASIRDISSAPIGIELLGEYSQYAISVTNSSNTLPGVIQANDVVDWQGNSIIGDTAGDPDQDIFLSVQAGAETPPNNLVSQLCTAFGPKDRIEFHGHDNISIKSQSQSTNLPDGVNIHKLYVGFEGSDNFVAPPANNTNIYGYSGTDWVDLDQHYVPLTGTTGITGKLGSTISNSTSASPTNIYEYTHTVRNDGVAPSSGYTYIDDAGSIRSLNYFGSNVNTSTTVGYQVSPGVFGSSATRGRSGIADNRSEIIIQPGSAGDFACYNGRVEMQVSGQYTHSGTDINHYGVPAGILFNGQITQPAGRGGEVYFNPYETILVDNGNDDVRAVSAVYNMERDGQRSGTKYDEDTVYWDGVRASSSGSVSCDTAFHVTGNWKNAMLCSANQKIGLNSSSNTHISVPPSAYIVFNSATNAIEFFVNGVREFWIDSNGGHGVTGC